MRHERYALSLHAEQEMQEDSFTETDIEEAILNGEIIRTQKDKLGRKVFTVEGTTDSFRKIRVICRFSDSGQFVIIITVYEFI